MQCVQMRSKLVQRGVEYSTIFICFAACVDDLELVKMRDGPQYCYATCKNEGWNTVQYSFVMQIVYMSQTCADEGKYSTVM